MKGCGTFQDVRRLPKRPYSDQIRAFGSALRALRQEHDLSMGEVARTLGCAITRLSDLERGETTDLRFKFCPDCSTGKWRTCKTCDGNGYVPKEVKP